MTDAEADALIRAVRELLASLPICQHADCTRSAVIGPVSHEPLYCHDHFLGKDLGARGPGEVAWAAAVEALEAMPMFKTQPLKPLCTRGLAELFTKTVRSTRAASLVELAESLPVALEAAGFCVNALGVDGNKESVSVEVWNERCADFDLRAEIQLYSRTDEPGFAVRASITRRARPW